MITDDGELHGWIGGSCSDALVRREALVAMSDGLPRLVRIRPDVEALETRNGGELTVATTCPSGGTLDIFIDPHLPRPLLRRHRRQPGRADAHRARSTWSGFAPAACIPERTPATSRAPTGCSTALDLGVLTAEKDCWVVVATMGHYDDDALAAALTLAAADVALVASVRRSAAVLETLRARGVPETELARVRAPAGARRAGAQEEIALHALAEVVALRHERLTANPVPAPAAIAGFAVDPVCGMTVDTTDAAYMATHDGQTYFFCCSGCREHFVAEPARFLRATAG